jgi:cell division protein FtsW
MDDVRRIRREPPRKPSTPSTKSAKPAKSAKLIKPRSVSKPIAERLAKFDIPFFIITLVLMVFGLGMLLSASYAFAAREHDDSYHFFFLQLRWMGLGLIAMLVISRINYRIFQNGKVVLILFSVSVILMIAVMFSSSGVEQGGAQRWINLGGVTFQPSEIMKFALIVMLSYMVHRFPENMKTLRKGFIPFMAVIGIACVLTIIQPHLSGTIIMFGIGLTLLIVSTIKFRYIILVLIGIVGAGLAVPPIMSSMGFTYVEDRFLSWHNPEADIQGATFQTYQSLVTIGSGGWFGLGLGNSRQKFSYLPATHNDFIFSVICEELGFIGGTLVLLLFVIFILRGFYIASHSRDRFGMMLGVGITAQIGIQAFLNIAVATNAVPNTGISLPFFSYGGTAILMMMAQIGVLLNISRKASID